MPALGLSVRLSPWRALLLVVWLVLTDSPATALAQRELPVHAVTEVEELDDRVELLWDRQGRLGLAEVLAQKDAFRPHTGGPLSFGFERSAVWLRFAFQNGSARSVRWLLELPEPTLDHVDVHVLYRDGRSEHLHGGDAVPFVARAVRHATFVFPFESAPGDAAVCYVRVQSDDVLRARLRAWAPPAYDAHHELENLLQAAIAGALVLVALYYLGVFWLVRQNESAWFALAGLSLCAVLVSLDGRFGQWLLRRQPELANRLPALSIAVAMLAVAFFAYSATARIDARQRLSRVLRQVAMATVVLLLAVLLVPAGVALRIESAILLPLTLAGPYLLWLTRRYDIPELSLYKTGWHALIVTIPIAILRYGGVWPEDTLSRWALPLGFVAYGLQNSLALAALTNLLRQELAVMNGRLVHNVEEMRQALVHAEEANQTAQRATRAKDEFLATMSHELRTPLNTIINIPQGLVNEFERVRSARCGSCGANFLLDEGERLTEATACEQCGKTGAWEEGSKLRFAGDVSRMLGFLQKIERSGQHLLQMVNGVLDYSKLEAGRFQLSLGAVDLDTLLREVSDQMSDIAHARHIQIDVESEPHPERLITADGLRLKQVLINLIANAIKFSEPHSTVIVRWTPLSHSDQIEVIDQGIGIAPEDQERIFASFEQVHSGATRKYGGTGLGLSISRSLVRMHAGELSVKSELGRGASFIVALPRLVSSTVSFDEPATSAGRRPRLRAR